MTVRQQFYLFCSFVLLALVGLGYGYTRTVARQTPPHTSAALSSEATATDEAVNADSPVSVTDLRSDYRTGTSSEKASILIVPGHEPTYGGTQFGPVYERNLVVEIGVDLLQYLQTDGGYHVFITRTTQSWTPVFSDYFNNDWRAITAWEKTSRQNASKLASLGTPSVPPIDHVTAPASVAMRLYGITKWANENHIDLMVHLHLNDYPRYNASAPGKYSGLVIYTPAAQYANSSTTRAIASAVFKRLSLYNPVDNLPIESSGVIDDPELIAVGANNTSDAASMLIEYDYIYESQFVNPDVRSLALKDLAYQTYLGLQDFFTKTSGVRATSSYHPNTLYAWNTPVGGKNSDAKDIYALQTALLMDGSYPPQDRTRNDCPHSGIFGACTQAALQAFQKKHGIIGENADGPKTFGLLQSIYNRK